MPSLQVLSVQSPLLLAPRHRQADSPATGPGRLFLVCWGMQLQWFPLLVHSHLQCSKRETAWIAVCCRQGDPPCPGRPRQALPPPSSLEQESSSSQGEESCPAGTKGRHEDDSLQLTSASRQPSTQWRLALQAQRPTCRHLLRSGFGKWRSNRQCLQVQVTFQVKQMPWLVAEIWDAGKKYMHGPCSHMQQSCNPSCPTLTTVATASPPDCWPGLQQAGCMHSRRGCHGLSTATKRLPAGSATQMHPLIHSIPDTKCST